MDDEFDEMKRTSANDSQQYRACAQRLQQVEKELQLSQVSPIDFLASLDETISRVTLRGVGATLPSHLKKKM